MSKLQCRREPAGKAAFANWPHAFTGVATSPFIGLDGERDSTPAQSVSDPWAERKDPVHTLPGSP